MDWKHITKLIFLNVLGVFLYAVGIRCFTAPHQIAPGGASGIATLVYYVCKFPIGLFVFLFNLPLLAWIWIKKYFPGSFVYKTLACTALLSLITDSVAARLPEYHGNPLLAAIFGGALLGIGLGLVHLGEANTGGISLLGIIIQKINEQFQVGSLISGLNMGVVLASVFIYKNIDSLLYAVLTVYISGIFMDKIVNQAASKNLLLVMANTTDKVRDIFLKEHIGITILKGEGGYTSETQRVILSAVNKGDCMRIKSEIKKADENALIIITEASRVEGKNFKPVI